MIVGKLCVGELSLCLCLCVVRQLGLWNVEEEVVASWGVHVCGMKLENEGEGKSKEKSMYAELELVRRYARSCFFFSSGYNNSCNIAVPYHAIP